MAARNTPVSASFATPARVRPQASTPSFSRRSPPCRRRRTELYGERAAFAALLLACQAEAHRAKAGERGWQNHPRKIIPDISAAALFLARVADHFARAEDRKSVV